MRLARWLPVLALAAMSSTAQAQPRPYVGYVYPAGGRQGTTVQVKLGGQNLDGTDTVLVTGAGVKASLISYQRRFGPQETQLLREQLKELRGALPRQERTPSVVDLGVAPPPPGGSQEPGVLIARIERRLAEYVQTPACASISNIAWVEVVLDPDAPPGPRELRLASARGVSNPIVFHVGQLPEVLRKPMISANLQVLGKEELALRKRPDDEVEQSVSLPCTLNGQVASGEVNRYRFEGRAGQKLVIATEARSLIPYIADAVPGWFQPVLTLRDASGREVAYNDDYRFRPDPVLLVEIPADGEYLLSITDALFRGREDFVYRVSMGELPFVTSAYPLGTRAGTPPTVALSGWNLDSGELKLAATDAPPGGILRLTATGRGLVSNTFPFAVDTLAEAGDHEPNDSTEAAQRVDLPVIVNGRIDRPDDRDVFAFEGRAGESVVVEVQARRLDSPVDSTVTLFAPDGTLLAYSDDCEDLGAGVNTHHADSYLLTTLPADGTYRVLLGDAARNGGDDCSYRLRIGPPRPDFELRVVPSSLSIRGKNAAPVDVHVIRKDGFASPIKVSLDGAPDGFSAAAATIPPDKPLTRLTIKTTLVETEGPVTLRVTGTGRIGEVDIVHTAVPAEDRMQAFLWRHLVPAQDFPVVVYDAARDPMLRRNRRNRP